LGKETGGEQKRRGLGGQLSPSIGRGEIQKTGTEKAGGGELGSRSNEGYEKRTTQVLNRNLNSPMVRKERDAPGKEKVSTRKQLHA